MLLFQQGGAGEEREQDPGTIQRHGAGQTQEDVGQPTWRVIINRFAVIFFINYT